eukprot:XP_001692947.1 predicted protein [Chlamydomonas reinhardtii]
MERWPSHGTRHAALLLWVCLLALLALHLSLDLKGDSGIHSIRTLGHARSSATDTGPGNKGAPGAGAGSSSGAPGSGSSSARAAAASGGKAAAVAVAPLVLAKGARAAAAVAAAEPGPGSGPGSGSGLGLGLDPESARVGYYTRHTGTLWDWMAVAGALRLQWERRNPAWWYGKYGMSAATAAAIWEGTGSRTVCPPQYDVLVYCDTVVDARPVLERQGLELPPERHLMLRPVGAAVLPPPPPLTTSHSSPGSRSGFGSGSGGLDRSSTFAVVVKGNRAKHPDRDHRGVVHLPYQKHRFGTAFVPLLSRSAVRRRDGSRLNWTHYQTAVTAPHCPPFGKSYL